MSKGPIRTPSPINISAGVNRAAGAIPTNRLVALGTPSATGERAITSLNAGGVIKLVGAVQREVAVGDAGDVYDAGDLVLESDGTGTISVGQRVCAVAGGSLAASGRVVGLPGSPTAGTNYEIVGEALTAAAAVAGAEVVVRWHRTTYQG